MMWASTNPASSPMGSIAVAMNSGVIIVRSELITVTSPNQSQKFGARCRAKPPGP